MNTPSREEWRKVWVKGFLAAASLLTGHPDFYEELRDEYLADKEINGDD